MTKPKCEQLKAFNYLCFCNFAHCPLAPPRQKITKIRNAQNSHSQAGFSFSLDISNNLK